MEAASRTEEQKDTTLADATKSVYGDSSSSSRSSSASLAAAKARAKVLAARARTTFVQKENDLLIEKARMDATLATLKLDKEIASAEAEAEAEALESTAAELERGSRTIISLPTQSPRERTLTTLSVIQMQPLSLHLLTQHVSLNNVTLLTLIAQGNTIKTPSIETSTDLGNLP